MVQVVDSLFSLYQELDQEIAQFKAHSGLNCRESCGLCCLRPSEEILCTLLELIPVARDLFQEGLASLVWEQAQKAGGESRCVFYEPQPESPFAGRCGRYTVRPLLCRLFGFSGFRDKRSRVLLTASRVMKEDFPEVVKKAQESMDEGLAIPLSSDWATRLAGIDPSLTQERMPLNVALMRAIEWVALRWGRDDDTPPNGPPRVPPQAA